MKKIKQLTELSILAGFILSSSNVIAEMYKWVDEEGNTQYTQQPPPDGINAETLQPPPRVDTEKAVNELEEKLENFDKQRDDKLKQEEEAMKTAEEESEYQQKCDKARKQLADLQRPRITTTDEKGNRSRMPEEERVAAIDKLNESIAKNCK